MNDYKPYRTREIIDLRDMLYQSEQLYYRRNAFKIKGANGLYKGISYRTFKTQVEYLGTSLIERNLIGKTFAVMGQNCYEWCVSYFAAACVGVVVPIDKELKDNDIVNIINVSETSVIFVSDTFIEKIRSLSSRFSCDVLIINMHCNKAAYSVLTLNDLIVEGGLSYSSGNTAFRDMPIDPYEMKILLFTSGTTGMAKGVMLCHRNICANIQSVRKVVKVYSSDQLISLLPLHHTYECTLGFLLPIYCGSCISYCSGLRHLSQDIRDIHPSVIICVPLLVESVYKKIEKALPMPISKMNFLVKKIALLKINNSLGGRLRLVITGAAPIDPHLVDSFNELGFGALQGYGLTECSPLVTGNNDFSQKSDSVGRAIPDVDVKIDNPDYAGIGEVLVRGSNVMLGYYKNPEETEKVFKNGWFCTGDLGSIDYKGFLHLTGRSKNVIVTKNGKNIYPEEVEYYLNSNPLISESIVSGAKFVGDDETYVEAHILPNIDLIKELLFVQIPTQEEIKSAIKDVIRDVNSKLPPYKHIKKFIIRDTEFDKTTTKKIKRVGNIPSNSDKDSVSVDNDNEHKN